MPITTRGLVLRITDFSNTSQIVTMFTRDLGLVTMLARGAYRPVTRSSSFSGAFDVAGWYDIVLTERRGDLARAEESDLIEPFLEVRANLDRFSEACFALELLARSVRPRDPDPELLLGTLRFLKLLGVGQGRVPLRIHFVQQLLTALGVAPDWDLCSECGEPVDDEEVVSVLIPDGVAHHECAPANRPTLPPVLRRYLSKERGLPWGRIPALQLHPQLAPDAWRLLADFLPYQLELRAKSEIALR